MEKIDSEKLKVAIEYINRMSLGNNPINNQRLQDTSFLDNPNVIRCMHFVEEVLTKVYNNQGYIGRIPKKKTENLKEFPFEALKDFQYQEDKTITALVDQINKLVHDEETRKIHYKPIVDWLKENEYLIVEDVKEINKKSTLATQKGNDVGIYFQIRTSTNGMTYVRVSYSEEAQYFIVSNLEKIFKNI